MKTFNDLTSTPIRSTIIKLALPIIGSSLLLIAYGIIDMLWIGKMGSEAVAAVGTAAFFINLGTGLNAIIAVGTGIRVAHRLGEKNIKEVGNIINTGFFMNIIIFLIYLVLTLTFKNYIISFFRFNNLNIEKMVSEYLIVTAFGIIFKFSNFMFVSVFNSFGDSKTPFKINCVGVLLNVVLDPLFIFTFEMGVIGAGVATVLAEGISTFMFYKYSKKYFSVKISKKYKMSRIKEIVKLGFPNGVQHILFTVIAIIIGRMIARWGASAIAAQKIGLQIEAVSFLTIEGFQGAVASFIGQNYGANKINRIEEGYKISLYISCVVGSVVTIAFLFFPKQLMSMFIRDDVETIKIGVEYLRVMGVAQILMCVEIVTAGAYSGIGRPKVSSWIGIIFTAIRIPIALILGRDSMFGITGIWITLAFSMMIKGILAYLFFSRDLKKFKER